MKTPSSFMAAGSKAVRTWADKGFVLWVLLDLQTLLLRLLQLCLHLGFLCSLSFSTGMQQAQNGNTPFCSPLSLPCNNLHIARQPGSFISA